MLEQGPDFWCWFDTTQFSYHCVHPIHAKMFSIQMSISQIVQRVYTLVLFIIIVLHVYSKTSISINKYMQKAGEPENDAGFLKYIHSQLNCSCSYPC